jgi:hypothetical protein
MDGARSAELLISSPVRAGARHLQDLSLETERSSRLDLNFLGFEPSELF